MKKDENVYSVEDIPVPETPSPDEKPSPWEKTWIIGSRKDRVDSYERVSGTAIYPSDLKLPNMLYGAILRCPHPHAKVKSVDTSKAEKMPGVHAVISGNDAEGQRKWSYKDVDSSLFDPVCRFEGEAVAAVAAETPDKAWDAAKAIRVEYEVYSFITDSKKALQDKAVSIHDKGNTVKTDKYERGDIQKGFGEADVVLEESYYASCEIHTPLELHGCCAYWDGDSLVIHESTQGVYAIQSKVSEFFRMPLSRVRVIGHYLGGGFGSKLKAGKYTVIAAILAKKSARPVKMFLTREETYLVAGNRPETHMTLKAGVRKNGELTALDFSCIGASGGYPAGGTSLVEWLIRDLYKCANVRTESTDVYINAGPARPFRAPGHPQGSWALEQMMDALAREIGMDPVSFRLKNIPSYSQAREGNPEYTADGYRLCLEEAGKAFGWENARKKADESNKNNHIKRGIGMAGSSWFIGGGFPPSTVIVKLFSDGSVNLNMGASDIGTGTKTIMAMVVSEELGVQPDSIQIEHADTGTTQYASPSGGSKTVPTEAPTVRNAVLQVKRELLDMAAKDLETDPSDLEFKPGKIVSKNDTSKTIKIEEISGLQDRGVVMGIGYRGPNPENKAIIPFAAQFCEVEVNTKTGEYRILRFVGSNESGRVMNRLTYDNQVFGGITMGIGFGGTETRILDSAQTGKMVNRNWHDYKLPTALDISTDLTSVPVELPDDEANNTGAKGLGEPVTIPTAAALANAVYDAVGIRITDTPITPMKLIERLSKEKKEV